MQISSCKAQGNINKSVSARKQSKLLQTLLNTLSQSARDMCCPRVSYQRQIFNYRHFLTLTGCQRHLLSAGRISAPNLPLPTLLKTTLYLKVPRHLLSVGRSNKPTRNSNWALRYREQAVNPNTAGLRTTTSILLTCWARKRTTIKFKKAWL
jgi:hypothetical protein